MDRDETPNPSREALYNHYAICPSPSGGMLEAAPQRALSSESQSVSENRLTTVGIVLW